MRYLWHEGEHVAIIGPTGRGKTTLGYELMPLRALEVIVAVKKQDGTLQRFMARSRSELVRSWGRVKQVEKPVYTIISEWPPPENVKKVILWDKPQRLGDGASQSARLYAALDGIYQEGNWAIFLDDANFICGVLHLDEAITYLMNMGRSAGISVVVAANRPRFVPRAAFSQARFVLSFAFNDTRDVDTIADIAGIDRQTYRQLNAQLKRSRHHFICSYDGRSVLVGK
jgi:ABC-type cobalamin transport system ATPase subunit